MEKEPVELKIYNLEDRLQVAAILIKNGYTVSMGKKKATPTGKKLDYFLRVTGNADEIEMTE